MMPTNIQRMIPGRLIALLVLSGAAVAQEAGLREWPEYQVIMWTGGSAEKQPEKLPLYYQRLAEMGVSAGMVYGDGDPQPLLDAKFPYYVENMVNQGLCLKFRSHVTDWDAFVTGWKDQRREDQCVRDDCLDDPAWLAEACREVQRIAGRNAAHRPLLYDLRDELSVTVSANPFDYDFSPLALQGFRDWLRAEDASLEELNERWQTDFGAWEDVRPFTTDLIKHRMASGDARPRGKPDWQAVQQLQFELSAARSNPTAWNLSPWADHRTYMDISLARVLDALRRAAHDVDPHTPVGIEGTQMPAAFGGYDLWRLSQVLDWVEPYDICDAREIFGSFMPGRTMLTTVGEQNAVEARRRLWHLLLAGDDGCIVWWSEDCIDWSSPGYALTPRARSLAPVLREMRSPLASLYLKAIRQRDPIAIHYSQPSIQVAWLLESTGDGSTWLRRFSSFEAAHNRHAKVRHAWLKLLENAGFDPVFVSSQQIEAGILESGGFRALVLPQSWAMSDDEADAITRFVRRPFNSGVVLADGCAGLFDDHGRLRERGALDGVFPADGSAAVVVVREGRPELSRELTAATSQAADAERTSGANPGTAIAALRATLLPIVPQVLIEPSDARVKVWRYALGPDQLLALERNQSYRMGEDLKQLADNSATAGDVTITLSGLPAAYAYDLRTGQALETRGPLVLRVSADEPTLIGLTNSPIEGAGVVEALHTGSRMTGDQGSSRTQ
jgi:hypothetical protein